jgi:hypothetical protein
VTTHIEQEHHIAKKAMECEIEKFSGMWESKDRYRLEIMIRDETSAFVSLYTPQGIPVNRPYFQDTPTINMPARYDDYYGEFTVDLWENNTGFELDLQYEEQYELDQLKRDALVPALTRHEADHFLDQYYPLFGHLKHFIRIGSVTQHMV